LTTILEFKRVSSPAEYDEEGLDDISLSKLNLFDAMFVFFLAKVYMLRLVVISVE